MRGMEFRMGEGRSGKEVFHFLVLCVCYVMLCWEEGRKRNGKVTLSRRRKVSR
jgi:hypothetical protein